MKDIKGVWFVWMFGAQVCAVCGVYFPMSEIKLTVPRAIKNFIIHPDDQPIINLAAIISKANKSSHLTYNLNESGEYLRINSNTGEIYFTTKFFNQIDKIGRIAMTANVEDTANSDSDKTILEVSVSPLKELDCNEIVDDVCFWSQAKYKIERTNVGIPVGYLSSPQLINMCPFAVNYTLARGSLVNLLPPAAQKNYWSFAITDKTRKSKDPFIKFKVNCIVETVGGKEKGNIRNTERDIDLELLDIDRYPPMLQVPEISIEFSKRSFKKGEKIEHRHLIFLDNDTALANHYDAYIVDGSKHSFLKPNCKEYPLTDKAQTVVHCRLELKMEMVFNTSMYSFVLVLNDTSLTNKNIPSTAELPIHLIFKDAPESLTMLKLYPSSSKIFKTAALFARVVQPKESTQNCSDFDLMELSKYKGIFLITRSQGIVYVNDFLKLKGITTEFLSLNISWTRDKKRESDQVEVRVVHEPNQTCVNISHTDQWNICSAYDSMDECLRPTSCAFGTGGFTSVETRKGPSRCMWRGDEIATNITHLYSTCTPDIKTCPDGECDSLEKLDDGLCPQDCTKVVVFPLKRNPKTDQGVDEASGTVVCNTINCHSIKSKKPKPNKIKDKHQKQHKEVLIVSKEDATSNVTLGNFMGSKCGFTCIGGIATGTLFLITSTISMIICWRIRKTKKSTRDILEKDNQELTAPLSFSGNRNGESLSFNFHMENGRAAMNDTTFINNIINKYSPDPKWEFPRSQLVIEQTLGEGEFGKVLRATAQNITGKPGYSTVAVKTLKEDARETELNDLLSEYQLLKEVIHPNVIRLLGVCTTPGGPVYLIIEYAEFGSLRNYLRRTRHLHHNSTSSVLDKEALACHYDEPKVSDITPKDLLSFAWQICNGMSYLSDMKLVHRDLAARNVLLTDDKVCKISDFGLTRDVYEDNAYLKKSKGRVPVKWMAPESLADHIYTTKSDVWSFGILVWELVTLGATPYPGIAVQNLFHLLRQGYRMERPDNCSPGLYKIMRNCWHIDPEQRPSFLDLSKWFAKLLEDKMEYINLSNNAIYNRGYFISPFEEEEEEAEETEEEDDTLDGRSSDINPLNYLSKTESLEKCKIRDKELNEQLEIMTDEKISNTDGYETPIKVPKRMKTPNNEDPQEYTNMGGK